MFTTQRRTRRRRWSLLRICGIQAPRRDTDHAGPVSVVGWLLAAAVAWDGRVSRLEGLVLVLAYVGFVSVIWIAEREPPTLGETGELVEAASDAASPTATQARVGRELVLVLLGVAAMAIGASVLVEGIRRITNVESTQTKLGLVGVGFASAFELAALAGSAARRALTTEVVAAL